MQICASLIMHIHHVLSWKMEEVDKFVIRNNGRINKPLIIYFFLTFMLFYFINKNLLVCQQ